MEGLVAADLSAAALAVTGRRRSSLPKGISSSDAKALLSALILCALVTPPIALALAYAEVTASDAIFIGVNAVDYSGYPDCRPQFLAAFAALANLATKRAVEGASIAIAAPIVDMTKADIVRRGIALGVDYSLTVSCYNADRAGRACGRCDACRFRRQGFAEAGIADPTRYQG